MKLTIDKQRGSSVHDQVVEQMKYHVEVGTWMPGAKVPTVRELSGALRINYNTVRAAYRTLEQEGYLVSAQGRGTFVAQDAPRVTAPGSDGHALDIVDEALAKAQAAGIDAETFVRLATHRAPAFAERIRGMRLLLIECNAPGLARYARQIEVGTGVRPVTLHVDEAQAQPASFFEDFDLVATTLFHIDEMRDAYDAKGLDTDALIALMIEPSYLHVVREITELPPGTHVGLVCTSEQAAASMERALLGVGADHLTLHLAGIDEPSQLPAVFEASDRVYVSPQAQEGHGDPWPSNTPVHLYSDDVSSAALRLLRRRLAEELEVHAPS
ncbi:MAG: GntR family transcriptional regulator [Bacteroidota bacterium]